MAWAPGRRSRDSWLREARGRLALALGAAGRVDEICIDQIGVSHSYRVTARCRISGSALELWANGDPDQALGEVERTARHVAIELP